MTALYLEVLVAIAASLSVLTAGAWVVQQRTGDSSWVDTIWTFSLGLASVGSALWPVRGVPPDAGSGPAATASCAPARSSRSHPRHDPGPEGRVSARWHRLSEKDRA